MLSIKFIWKRLIQKLQNFLGRGLVSDNTVPRSVALLEGGQETLRSKGKSP